MILTILSHMTAVRILFAIGITFTVLPIFFYEVILRKKNKKILRMIIPGIILCIPMIFYGYIDIRYDVGSFSANDKLYLAAENGNISAAQAFIAGGADPEGDTRYGNSAIFRTVQLNDSEQLELYLRIGADPNYANDDNMTLLSLACMNQCSETAELLINFGADPDYRSDSCVPALHYAAAYDQNYNAELVKLLIDAGADPASEIIRDGKRMLPFRYFFDEYTDDEDITDTDEINYMKIKDMLYRPYIDWLMEKMVEENDERSAEIETVS